MTEDAIVAAEIIETEYGEKLAIKSPFDAKDFINTMPWKETQEEIEEYGSLKEKAVSRGMASNNIAIKAAEDFGFSDTFSAHATWDPKALGQDEGAWLIDTDAWDEASEYFEHCGFEVENKTSL